jgi:hypothetical protein
VWKRKERGREYEKEGENGLESSPVREERERSQSVIIRSIFIISHGYN